MAQAVRSWPQNPTRPIGLSNRKMASGIKQVKIELSRAGLVQQQYEVHTKVRVAINALDYEYNHDERTQSPRLTAARLQRAVGRGGLGPREQEEQRNERASFVTTYHTRAHIEQQLMSWARMLSLKKIPREAPRHVSSRPDYSLSVGLDA